MIIMVPWAIQRPIHTLATSALPDAPVVQDTPSALTTLLRRLTHQA